jgi:hypothetical protein
MRTGIIHRGIYHRLRLVQGLVHCGTYGTYQVGLFAKLRTVGYGLNTHMSAMQETDADALAPEPVRKLGHHGSGSVLEACMVNTGSYLLENGGQVITGCHG